MELLSDACSMLVYTVTLPFSIIIKALSLNRECLTLIVVFLCPLQAPPLLAAASQQAVHTDGPHIAPLKQTVNCVTDPAVSERGLLNALTQPFASKT